MARAGRWQRALCILQLFHARGDLRCDGASYATAIDASTDTWPKALELLILMPLQSLWPSRIQYTAVCDVCTKADNWERALDVFDLSKTFDTLDVILSTSGLAAVSKSSQWMSSLWTFAALRHWSLEPNTITGTSALSACERSRQWQMSLMALSDMLGTRLVNEVSFTTTMQACEKSGKWQLLSSLLATMTAPWICTAVFGRSRFSSSPQKCSAF